MSQGGRLPAGNLPNDPAAQAQRHDPEDYSSSQIPATGPLPYELHLQQPTPQQRFSGGDQPFNQPEQRPTQYNLAHGQPGGAFSMTGMVGALPEYQGSTHPYASPQTQHRFPSGVSPSAVGYQPQQFPQFAGQTPINSSGYSTPYYSQYGTPFQQQAPSAQAYGAPASHQTHPGVPGSFQSSHNTPQFFSGHQQQQYNYHPGQYGHANQPQQGLQGRPVPSGGFSNQRSAYSYGQGPIRHQDPDTIAIQGGFAHGASGPFLRPGNVPAISRQSSNSSSGAVPSAPRGPPRKPKQSGHALWVGNLPPGTIITDLKDHFSRDATQHIESVFLISKSNCAFVNYRTETACATAMARFHDSRFQEVRLVCRLRRSSAVASSGVPTGPAALMPGAAQSQSATEAIAQNREVSSRAEELANAGVNPDGEGIVKAVDKFFIMKSLTVEDMELSVRNGIWATQAHNEAALNKAYEATENVYLVFSANKSGEYFGYARMTSSITEDAAADLDWAPRAETIVDDLDLPRSIPTPATRFAPKGRIIDDSARGTIFWEADLDEQDILTPARGDDDAKSLHSVEDAEEAAPLSGVQSFGKPFKIEWLSTTRLPFYRTRGLRNPWNANREVKIARDGTELETNVGRRLVQMFQRSVSSPTAQGSVPAHSGYPPLR